MIRIAFLASLLLFSACSLVHKDLPNEPPVIELARFVCITTDGQRDTVSVGETCQVSRGGEVQLNTFASDEDDDPLFYRWNSFGAGSFRDSLAAQTSWFAPPNIESSSETFSIQASISDRDCDSVQLEEDRQRCLSSASTQRISFTVTVVQRAPALSVVQDTTVFFEAPQAEIEAYAADPDNDALTYDWQQLDQQPTLSITSESILDDQTGIPLGSRASFIPTAPGSYRLQVTVSDGDAVIESEISIQVVNRTPLPASGMVALELTTSEGSTHAFEIDAYEYPNRLGEKPLLATWFDAATLCAAEGKRLCEPAEWKHACAGDNALQYSSTDDVSSLESLADFGLRFCNTARSYHSTVEDGIAESGSYPNCQSGNGVYDLTGNLREWTGEVDTFGDWLAGSSLSNATLDEPDYGATCASTERFEFTPLQGARFDFSDAASIQQFLSELSADQRQQLDQPLTGFRCCR